MDTFDLQLWYNDSSNLIDVSGLVLKYELSESLLKVIILIFHNLPLFKVSLLLQFKTYPP